MSPAAASFHPKPEIALRRLQAAIDGDPKSPCFSDNGYEASYYPHSCEFSKEGGAVLSGVAVEFPDKQGRPDEVVALESDDGKTWKRLQSRRLEPKAAKLNLDFGNARVVKFLRLEFHRDDEKSFAQDLKDHPLKRKPGQITEDQSPAYDKIKDSGAFVQINHLELLQPQPQVELAADGFAVAAPAGFEVRYTLDGRTPSRSSPLAPSKIAAVAAPALCTRLFAIDWDGPVRVDMPPKTPFVATAPSAPAAKAVAAQPLRRFFPEPPPVVAKTPEAAAVAEPLAALSQRDWLIIAGLSAAALFLLILILRFKPVKKKPGRKSKG